MGRLFWKIFIGFWLIQVAIGSAVGLAVYLHNKTQFNEVTYLSSGGAHAEFVLNAAALALHFGGPNALGTLLSDRQVVGHIQVLVINPEGQDIFDRPVPPSALNNAKAALATGKLQKGLRVVSSPSGQVYLLFIPAEIDGQPTPVSNLPMEDSLTVRLAAAIIASLIFSLLLAWNLTRPIRYLQRAVNTIATGDLSARVTPKMRGRRDEIADLGRDFDHMAERLQTIVDTQQRLLHDVSHELRSPLARMQVALALAHQQPDKLYIALERIERESTRLDELVGELLTLARLGAGVGMEAEGIVDLAGLLETIIEDANFEADSERHVELIHDDHVVITGREELLRRAFENVIRNALRYTPEKGVVSVSAQKEGDWYQVSICDRGPGLSGDKLKTIFEPFVRADASPTGGRSGYGLGLAITRRALESHGGKVWAENRTNGGLCVYLALPLKGMSGKVDSRGKKSRASTRKKANPSAGMVSS